MGWGRRLLLCDLYNTSHNTKNVVFNFGMHCLPMKKSDFVCFNIYIQLFKPTHTPPYLMEQQALQGI